MLPRDAEQSRGELDSPSNILNDIAKSLDEPEIARSQKEHRSAYNLWIRLRWRQTIALHHLSSWRQTHCNTTIKTVRSRGVQRVKILLSHLICSLSENLAVYIRQSAK